MQIPKKGTIIMSLNGFGPFSALRNELICSERIESGLIEVWSIPKSRLLVRYMADSKKITLEFVSQPIYVRLPENGPPMVIIMITFSSKKLGITINRMTLQPDGAGAQTVRIDFPATKPVSNILSFNRPESATSCAVWIARRRQKFASKKQRSARRDNNLSVEAQRLESAMKTLEHLATEVKNGSSFLVGSLATELRGLLYWDKDDEVDPSYNPLLLRVASKADIPLPVYGAGRTDILDSFDLILSRQPSWASINNKFSRDKLIDIQEWLQWEMMLIGSNQTVGISARQLISEVAATLGSAHYDESSSVFVDLLASTKLGSFDALSLWLIQGAETTIYLSEWVLHNLKAQNLIV